MGAKNLGPQVDGYLDPEGRAWESVVCQNGKPVLAKDFNLSSELDVGAAQALLKRAIPSGWLDESVLTRSSSASSLFVATTVSNGLDLPAMSAHVNGWFLSVVNTGVSGSNRLVLEAAPSGAGTKRTDLVFLEVWRRLIPPPTETEGKSQTGRIWRNGNVKVSSSDDVTLNFTDDIKDVVVGESTRRVQIQYRLRAVSGVDIYTYPAGLDDPSVTARTVPVSAAAPDGASTGFAYSNLSSGGDSGLWRAGDGNPGNALGTVDGYIYAIPVCAVFRRNSTAFDRNANHNGGGPSSGSSGRPDGRFHDRVAERDLADLRRVVSLRGWDYSEVIQKNFYALLDNQLRGEWGSTTIGGGVNGHTLFTADEIGISNANGGNGTTTGDTPGANFIGQFDYVRRRFSDRPIYEVVTVRLTPGGAGVSTATWQSGTVITLNPTALTPYPYSAFNLTSFAPSATRIIDVVGAKILGSAGTHLTCDVGFPQSNASLPFIPLVKVEGVGVHPMVNVVLTLGTIPGGLAGLTTESIYIDLLVAYPAGQGATYTPTGDFGAASFSINNPGALPATSPVRFSSLINQEFDYPHREINLQYLTTSSSLTVQAYNGGSTTVYKLPERAASLSVTKNGSPATFTLDVDGRTVTLTVATVASDELIFTYSSVRPIPQTGAQLTIYYDTRAPQAVRSSLLGTSQSFVPRSIYQRLFAITAGSGSPGEGYPFPYAYVQTGGISNPISTFVGEHQLAGSEKIFVGDFNASTGLLQVPVYVPYSPDPSLVEFQRVSGDVDAEGRSFFPTVPSNQYAPNAYGNPLSDARVHKVVLPCLMEAIADSSLGRKGSLYLVLLVRWANFDPDVSVEFNVDDSSANTTVACVMRLNGNLLNRSL